MTSATLRAPCDKTGPTSLTASCSSGCWLEGRFFFDSSGIALSSWPVESPTEPCHQPGVSARSATSVSCQASRRKLWCLCPKAVHQGALGVQPGPPLGASTGSPSDRRNVIAIRSCCPQSFHQAIDASCGH